MTLTCVTCHGPLVELGSLGHATHYRCRDCGADQSILTARTDVTRPSKTREEIALGIQDACNPTAVANELCEQITRFSKESPHYAGTASICNDAALRAIAYKLADLFHVADFNAWEPIAKALNGEPAVAEAAFLKGFKHDD
jgi:hypothetical protein